MIRPLTPHNWFCCKVWDHARESVGWTSLRGQSEHLVDQLRLPDHVALRHPSRLSLAERMHDLDAAQGPPRRGESLEVQHRPGAAFDESVVLLDDVVQILALAKIRTRSDESLVSDGLERDRVGGGSCPRSPREGASYEPRLTSCGRTRWPPSCRASLAARNPGYRRWNRRHGRDTSRPRRHARASRRSDTSRWCASGMADTVCRSLAHNACTHR